ncbi:hypothetical protein V6N11_039819 [Hibiscus sabdariffa]|uniref:Uncharacterized protein n=1 Tax=Hibiscus sabdariffa TaxID=183260 RepID=A0ABR2RG09_9ROSI
MGHEQRLPTTLFKTQVSSMGEEGTNMLSCRLYKTNGLGSMWEYLGKDMALLAELLEYGEGPGVGLKRDKGVVPWWYMGLRILGLGVIGSHM